MVTLSDEARELLGMLQRAAHGGPPAPAGFENSYAELQRHAFILGTAITNEGDAALRARFLTANNPDLLRSKKQPKARHS